MYFWISCVMRRNSSVWRACWMFPKSSADATVLILGPPPTMTWKPPIMLRPILCMAGRCLRSTKSVYSASLPRTMSQDCTNRYILPSPRILFVYYIHCSEIGVYSYLLARSDLRRPLKHVHYYRYPVLPAHDRRV